MQQNKFKGVVNKSTAVQYGGPDSEINKGGTERSRHELGTPYAYSNHRFWATFILFWTVSIITYIGYPLIVSILLNPKHIKVKLFYNADS